MSLLKNCIRSGVALTAALGFIASHANAQQGSFNLPFEAHWGGFVLPPGSYRISIPTAVSLPRIIEVSSNGRTMPILVGIEDLRSTSDRNYLQLTNTGGTHVVRELHLGASGRVFTFLLPKTTGTKLADLQKTQETRLPIGTSGQ